MARHLLLNRGMTPCTSPDSTRVRWLVSPLLAVVALFTVGCAGPGRYTYEYIPGRTATVTSDGMATVPARAPEAVAAGIEAGNRIAGSSYSYGGGHGGDGAGGGGGFDCSGSASYVLRAMGRLHGTMTSDEFRHYGESGAGRWVSVWARRGHVFLVVAGLRFDTGWNDGGGNSGPRWSEGGRPADGCVLRHPAGL